MRLCYIAPAASVHTERWLQAFVLRGHDVHLLALPGAACEIAGVTVHRLPEGRPKLRFVQWTRAARHIVRRLQPDVLHAHYLTRYGWLAAAIGFHPLVLTAWGTDAYVDPRRSRLTRMLTSLTLRRADIVTADAADLLERVVALGARAKRTHVVQWGVDTDMFRPDVDTAPLRTRLGLDGRPVILSTRSLSPNYNQSTILRALPAIMSAVPDAALLIKYSQHDPAYLAELQRLSASLGIESAVQFIGASTYQDLAAYYALADIFVSVASSDSTPVSLLEAMACGAAPVVSNLPALQEWIDDGCNGRCVAPRDQIALADAVIGLLGDEGSRRTYARVNRVLIEERASHSTEMQRMEQLYSAVAAARSRA